MKIQTERLILEPLGLERLETTHAYSSDIENTALMVFLPNESIEETKQFLIGAENEWKKDKPSFYEFAILLNGRHIGAVSLYLNEERTEAELGWIIAKDFWGRGYASEAARAAVDFAEEALGIRHFIAHCDGENYASAKVMEKLGMTMTCTTGGRKNRSSDDLRTELIYEMTL